MPEIKNPFVQDQKVQERNLTLGIPEGQEFSPTQSPFEGPVTDATLENPLEVLQEVGITQDAPKKAPSLRFPKKAQTVDIRSPEFSKSLAKAGLGSLMGELAFNEFGKLQLIQALKQRFGENFEENSVAKGILADFEQGLEQDPESADKDLKKRTRMSERLLSGLFRRNV